LYFNENLIDIRYAKEVLTKVSFEKNIFERELKKFLKIISPEQQSELELWCRDKFEKDHKAIINSAFPKKSSISSKKSA